MSIKTVLAISFIGHILCGITDCLLSYTKSGRINIKVVNDSEKMSAAFADYPANNALMSMLLGVAAIAMFTFGYIRLSQWMDSFSHIIPSIMYISAVAGMIVMTAHHVFCGVVYWFYVRLGRTSEAREAVMDFFKKTSITMIAGYIGLGVFCISLFVAVVSGKTDLPQWACIFNTVFVLLVTLPTKLPAKGNIAGAVMFLGLLILI